MKKYSRLSILLSILFLISFRLQAADKHIEGLFVSTFGNRLNPSIVFVHGGPGHSSHDFEVKTAPELALKGYFVVAYDQRGQGRSAEATDPADYTYKKYSDDLMTLIHTLKLQNVTLLGHSHGGPIALQFAKHYPGVAGKIILASAPVNFFSTMQSIFSNCSARFQMKNNASAALKLESEFAPLLDPNSTLDAQVNAVADVFQTGGSCGLYQSSQPTAAAIDLKTAISLNPPKVSQNNQFYPMPGFLINENYIRQDYTLAVKINASRIFGIYGDEDGLFTPQVLEEIKSALALNLSPYKFQVIKRSSHALYVDQNSKFIDALIRVLK